MTEDQVVCAYLQQVQPRDLADLLSHAHHDLSMLANSYASYLELLEMLRPTISFPEPTRDDITQYCQGMHESIVDLHQLMTHHAVNPTSKQLRFFFGLICSDSRRSMSIMITYVFLIQREVEQGDSTSQHQRAAHLIDAMYTTVTRMLSISHACLDYQLNDWDRAMLSGENG